MRRYLCLTSASDKWGGRRQGAPSGRRSSGSGVTVSTQPSADRQGQQAERSHEQKGLAASSRIEQARRECQQKRCMSALANPTLTVP